MAKKIKVSIVTENNEEQETAMTVSLEIGPQTFTLLRSDNYLSDMTNEEAEKLKGEATLLAKDLCIDIDTKEVDDFIEEKKENKEWQDFSLSTLDTEEDNREITDGQG
jgi:hypothetical protein